MNYRTGTGGGGKCEVECSSGWGHSDRGAMEVDGHHNSWRDWGREHYQWDTSEHIDVNGAVEVAGEDIGTHNRPR